MKALGQLFTEEDNIRFDQAFTLQTARDPFLLYGLSHQIIRITRPTFDATVSSETAMGFHNLVSRNTGITFQTVDILREQFQEQTSIG